jgi:hypothetical protein
MKTTILGAVLFAAVVVPAVVWAQQGFGSFGSSDGGYGGYTIITPDGSQPTFVMPNYNGGYTVITPDGSQPTFIDPTPNGGWVAITPDGRSPTFIEPTFPSVGETSPPEPNW